MRQEPGVRMNGFEKHGIGHSSPSAINLFANAPCAFVAKYLYGKTFKFGLAARAGVLVENAVVNVLARGFPAEAAISDAVDAYNKETAFGCSESERKRGDGIPGMIENALEALAQYGEPEFDRVLGDTKQKKIELLCRGDGWTLPVIGFLDLHFPKHGLVVDLKTTMAAPSVMSEEHTRQGCIYRQAMGNQAVRFLYVTPKKAVWHDVPEPAPVLAEVKAILTRQERLLRLEAEDIRAMVPVISGSYYWSGDEEIRKELYGI